MSSFPICDLVLSAAIICFATLGTVRSATQIANVANLGEILQHHLRFPMFRFFRRIEREKFVPSRKLASQDLKVFIIIWLTALCLRTEEQVEGAVEAVVLLLDWCVDLAKKDAGASANVASQSLGRRHLTQIQPCGFAAHFAWEEVALQPPRLALFHKSKVDRSVIAFHVVFHVCAECAVRVFLTMSECCVLRLWLFRVVLLCSVRSRTQVTPLPSAAGSPLFDPNVNNVLFHISNQHYYSHVYVASFC